MGVFYLFLILAGQIFLETSVGAVSKLLDGSLEQIGIVYENSSDLIVGYFSDALAQINWQARLDIIITNILQTKWISNTISGFANFVTQNFADLATNIGAEVNTAMSTITASILVSAGIILFSIWLAYTLCRIVVKRQIGRAHV